MEVADFSGEVGDQPAQERQKTSSIASTSPSKTSTRARPPSLPSHETHSAPNVMGREAKMALSEHATHAVVVVSKSLSVRWAQ